MYGSVCQDRFSTHTAPSDGSLPWTVNGSSMARPGRLAAVWAVDVVPLKVTAWSPKTLSTLLYTVPVAVKPPPMDVVEVYRRRDSLRR